MRIYIFLIFVCASALARSKYKRETSQGISFSDKAGISAGLNGAEGHFKKSIGLKPFLLNPFDTTSENKGIDLNIGGNVGLKPKLNFGEEGVGMSLGGSGDLGVGISGSKEKKHSEKKHSKKHKQSKENSSSEKSSEESVIGEIWKEINNGISAGVKGDAGFSIGTGGISASIGGDVSAGANSKNDGSSSSNEEEVIIIPIVDGENSGSYEISDETKINQTNVRGVIIIGDKETSLGDKEKSDNSSGNKNKKHVDKNGSEKHQNEHSGKKEEYSKHSGKDIITSHDKSKSNKEHINENRNNNNHTREEGGIVISHEEHNSQNRSKGHQGLSKENETKNSGITEGSKNTHTGGSITKSHNSGGKTSSEHKERNSKTGTGENLSHENDQGTHVNLTIDGSHGTNHNKSKNSTVKIGVIDGKDSSHGKNNEDSNNCNEILNNEQCGSHIKQTLQVVQTFIRGCHAIVHFLLELNETELRRVLCEILPHDSKLSCQLGCNILRVIRHD